MIISTFVLLDFWLYFHYCIVLSFQVWLRQIVQINDYFQLNSKAMQVVNTNSPKATLACHIRRSMHIM